jgi:anti-sigma factor (TIGR02949 family)
MEHENCRHLLGSLSDFLDGSLEADLCAEVERHLAECENCRIVVDSLNKTVYLYHTTSQEVSVPEDVRERLFRRLNLDDYMES